MKGLYPPSLHIRNTRQSWILDFTLSIPDFRYWTPGFVFWIPHAKFPGFWIPQAKTPGNPVSGFPYIIYLVRPQPGDIFILTKCLAVLVLCRSRHLVCMSLSVLCKSTIVFLVALAIKHVAMAAWYRTAFSSHSSFLNTKVHFVRKRNQPCRETDSYSTMDEQLMQLFYSRKVVYSGRSKFGLRSAHEFFVSELGFAYTITDISPPITHLSVENKTFVGSDAVCFESKLIVSLKKQPRLH